MTFLCVIFVPVLENLAVQKPSSQISIWNNKGTSWESDKGNDGDANSNIYQNHCFHTDKHMSPWWEVDLQDVNTISKVVITNRADCCGMSLFIPFNFGCQITTYKIHSVFL
jgi:hypothetical protein